MEENNICNKDVYVAVCLQCVCSAGSAQSTRHPCGCPLLRAPCILKIMPFARKSTSKPDTKLNERAHWPNSKRPRKLGRAMPCAAC